MLGLQTLLYSKYFFFNCNVFVVIKLRVPSRPERKQLLFFLKHLLELELIDNEDPNHGKYTSTFLTICYSYLNLSTVIVRGRFDGVVRVGNSTCFLASFFIRLSDRVTEYPAAACLLVAILD